MVSAIFTVFFSMLTLGRSGQNDTLRQTIEQLVEGKKATVGVGIFGFEDNYSLFINPSRHFPLLSVFKFHTALTVLDMADKGRISLQEKIFIKKSELVAGTHSPFRDKYPKGNRFVTVNDMLYWMVSESDNMITDILLKRIGGTKKVNDYVHSVGIIDVYISANEQDMHRSWEAQYTNWTTPRAAIELLSLFYKRRILSHRSFTVLWKMMTETSSGADRIRGQLAAGTVVAHKTGSSDTKDGITAATNDIGIVTLPNGKHFAIAVFITNSAENDQVNARIIADIARAAAEYFAGHSAVAENR